MTFILSVTGTAFSILEMFFSQVRAGGVIFILSFSIFASFLLTSTQRFFVWQRSRSDACPYSKIVIVVRTSSLEQRWSATINSNWLFLCNGSVLLLEWGMQGWSNKEDKSRRSSRVETQRSKNIANCKLLKISINRLSQRLVLMVTRMVEASMMEGGSASTWRKTISLFQVATPTHQQKCTINIDNKLNNNLSKD